MKSTELVKALKKLGATFVYDKPKGGHITVELNGKKSFIPMHGSRKELGTGLVNKIYKDLGLR